jgi:hypothetical protein
MSDFIGTLFSRSFKPDTDLEVLQPLLPSMFEPPLAGKTSIATSFDGIAGKLKQDEPEFVQKTEHIESLSIKPQNHHDLDTKVSKSNVHDFGHLQPNKPHQDNTEGKGSQKNIEFGSPPIMPLFQTIPDNHVHKSGHEKNKPSVKKKQSLSELQSVNDQEIPSQAQIVSKTQNLQRAIPNISENRELNDIAEINSTRYEPFLAEDKKINTLQQLPTKKFKESESSGQMTVNSVTLDRIVRDKMNLYANQDNLNSKKSSNDSPPLTQTPLLAPIDLLKLNLQRPHIFDHKQFSENKLAKEMDTLEPVINVTIGRIEIRATAVTPNLSRKSEVKKSTAMSLEEYLNKRNGGAK